MDKDAEAVIARLYDTSLSDADISPCISIIEMLLFLEGLPPLLNVMKGASYSISLRTQAAKAVAQIGSNQIERELINFGYFTGEYPAAFVTSDFVRFRDGLKKILSTMDGSTSFETHEEALNCTIEMRDSGTARIKGEAQVHQNIAAALSFSFESDQSFVAQTLREVEAIIAEYPVRVEPGKTR